VAFSVIVHQVFAIDLFACRHARRRDRQEGERNDVIDGTKFTLLKVNGRHPW